MVAQVGVEQIHQAPVGCFDDRPGSLIGADHRQAPDLALGKPCFCAFDHRFSGTDSDILKGQDVTRLLDIGRITPAEMKHRLRHPFIGEVFQQAVDEAQGRLIRANLAGGPLGFKPADQRRGVRHGFDHAVDIGQVEGRQQFDGRAWQAQPVRHCAGEQAIGNVPVAQQRQHLARVGRTRRALEQQ